MAREFDRNMFIMLLAIMIGIVIITAFIGDIIKRSDIDRIEKNFTQEKEDIIFKNENYTNNFMKSTVILFQAVDDRGDGNNKYYSAYDDYQKITVEKNIISFESDKTKIIDNCEKAMNEYSKAYNNFQLSIKYFNYTKTCTDYYKYLEALDLFINLSESGSTFSILRYNASSYLKYLTENLILNTENGTISYDENVTEILELFNETILLIEQESEKYEDIKDELDEYEFFDEIR